ncbi:hypothetical protein K6119_04140 [Paracrocinitomix mangrovi]|uniref:hypothetical protein n=1 Tax=Paracrocinitomix mangrovi TaxID=2862509 RepID=UPI001EDA5BE1|nr:hypothetical protein [Paracrocinitomix mangrovi]UKN02703.1 hypothetical protein K6119_04140 [Paracrocinitomix mangrovi]
MTRKFKFLIANSLICFVLFSCNFEIDQSDENGLTDLDWEVTTPNLDSQKDNIIFSKINDFLISDSSAIVQNYFFLCDTSQIKSFRGYNVKHKNENIWIGLGKDNASVRPLPDSYPVEEGPIGEYNIVDDSLGRLHSYVLEFQFSEEYEIDSVYAVLRFARTENGVKKVSYVRDILISEDYLLEKRIQEKNW